MSKLVQSVFVKCMLLIPTRYPLTVSGDKDVQLHHELEITSLMMTPSKLHELLAEDEEYQ